MLLTQNQNGNEGRVDKIPCVDMHTMKTEISPDVPIRYYNGSKKLAMPEIEGRRQVLPLRILANQRVGLLLSSATALDGQFLRHRV